MHLIPLVSAPDEMTVTSISTYDQFKQHVHRTKAEAMRRRDTEKRLARDVQSFRTRGFCFTCNRWTLFSSSWAYAYEVDGRLSPNWREHLVCPGCGLNNRMRAVIHLLTTTAGISPSCHVYVTEQTTPLFARVSQMFPHTTGSEYLGHAHPLGKANSAGIRNEDLTRLSFADETFDAVLCFDVFEHVPDYRRAFRECARVLKPEGKMLFSAPFDVNAERNVIRARVLPDGSIDHLLPPEYHGDPLNPAGVLAFQSFGWEMLAHMEDSGFSSVVALLYYSSDFGYLGGEQVQFLAKR